MKDEFKKEPTKLKQTEKKDAKKDESESNKYIIKNGKKGDYHPKVKSEGKPMEFYKQSDKKGGKVHIGAVKEK